MRYLTLSEVLELHRQIINQSGGAMGILNLGGLESALAQPRMTFAGSDLYPTIADKASALGFSLILNHPFIDGNKRTAFVVMRTFLLLNGKDINTTQEDKYFMFLKLAEGKVSEEELVEWIREKLV